MISEHIRSFRSLLKQRSVIGPFAKSCDPAFIEALGFAGFDFVILDLEHGPASVQSLQNLIRAAQAAKVFPIVRVKEQPLSLIGEVLDVGAGGIQVPQVTRSADVRQVLELARFAPAGKRGVCRYVRAADYSLLDRFAYFKQANEALIVLQLEGAEALANLDDILQVEGSDIIFIGPYDLSQSLGVPGQTEHPRVIQAMQQIVAKCLSRNIAVGTFVESPAAARKWAELGLAYISYSVDVGLFAEKCREVVDAFRANSIQGGRS